MKTKIADDLMSAMEQCKPGQSKPYQVMVHMDKDGNCTLSMGSEATEEKAEESAPKKGGMGKRPKPVMAAIKAMTHG